MKWFHLVNFALSECVGHCLTSWLIHDTNQYWEEIVLGTHRAFASCRIGMRTYFFILFEIDSFSGWTAQNLFSEGSPSTYVLSQPHYHNNVQGHCPSGKWTEFILGNARQSYIEVCEFNADELMSEVYWKVSERHQRTVKLIDQDWNDGWSYLWLRNPKPYQRSDERTMTTKLAIRIGGDEVIEYTGKNDLQKSWHPFRQCKE